jgi:ASC-1-like (ASCH) protein
MTIHQMKLSAAPFEKIARGKKIIESRLYDEKRQQIRIGDEIEFTSNDDPSKKAVVKVTAIYLYPDFESMFYDFPPEKFGGASPKDLLLEIERFYPKAEQDQFGVVGIKLNLIN